MWFDSKPLHCCESAEHPHASAQFWYPQWKEVSCQVLCHPIYQQQILKLSSASSYNYFADGTKMTMRLRWKTHFVLKCMYIVTLFTFVSWDGTVKRVGTAFHNRFLRLPKPLKQSGVKWSEQITMCFLGWKSSRPMFSNHCFRTDGLLKGNLARNKDEMSYEMYLGCV